MPINKLHHTLLDASLPATIEDLKNPTQEYVVNLLTVFLSHFGIDISLINQATPEQLNVMPYHEDSDVVNLINLCTVMSQVFNKIFLYDFCLTDITSPGQKRFKKQAKFLANFILYTMHKKSKFNDKLEFIQTMSKQLEEMKEKKAQTSELINKKIMHKAKQVDMIQKLEDDLKGLQSRMEKINKKTVEIEAVKNNVEKKNKKAKELYGSSKTIAVNLTKKITEIQSQVVHSPEKHQSRLDELKKQYKLKEEERAYKQEHIQEKKQYIKQIEEKLNFVQKITEDFSILSDTYTEHSNKRTELNDVKKEIDSLNTIMNKQQTKLAKHKDQVNVEKHKLQINYEEDIIPLQKLHSLLLSDKKKQKIELDKAQECYNEKYMKRNKLQTDIKKVEQETEIFMSNCQKAYDSELVCEAKLRQSWV
ncbi:hypothetical protein PUN28_011353 [Cardiocondyla obscurior]